MPRVRLWETEITSAGEIPIQAATAAAPTVELLQRTTTMVVTAMMG